MEISEDMRKVEVCFRECPQETPKSTHHLPP